MTLKRSNRLEGWGLILILGSFLWQLIENDLTNISESGEYYRLHSKLDAIWYVYSHDYISRNPDTGISFDISFKAFFDNWKIYSQILKETKQLSNQIDVTLYIRVLIFIIGSILVIIPKFSTLKKE
jgi:hypothetical protein